MLDVDGRPESPNVLCDIVAEDYGAHRRLPRATLAHQEDLFLSFSGIHLDVLSSCTLALRYRPKYDVGDSSRKRGMKTVRGQCWGIQRLMHDTKVHRTNTVGTYMPKRTPSLLDTALHSPIRPIRVIRNNMDVPTVKSFIEPQIWKSRQSIGGLLPLSRQLHVS